MKASRYIFPFLLVFGFAAVASAQIFDTYVIPVSGNVPGAFGTRWMTQFSVFNPQQYDLHVSVTLVPTGGGQGATALIRVPANSLAYSDNILKDLFNLSGSGALLVATFPEDNPGVPDKALDRSFALSTETYNNAPSGTYSQTIPGTFAGLMDFNFDGITAVAHGIRNLASAGWRTNVGAVNLGRSNVTLRVSVYDADGRTIVSKAPLDLPPLGHRQAPLPVEVNIGTIEFFVDDPSQQAVVFPYSSTIDQFSGDPRYQSPVLLATAQTLFGKGPVTPQSSLGRKITLDDVRPIRNAAINVGEKELRPRK